MAKRLLAVLLVVSLAANAAWLIHRSSLPPAGNPAGAASGSATNGPKSAEPAAISRLIAGIESGDVAVLKDAGLSAETIRELKVGRAFARLQARMRAAQPAPAPDDRYWRRPASIFNDPQAMKRRAAIIEAQREFTAAIREAYGDDATVYGGTDTRYAFLPAAKREQLRRIDQDYADMQEQVYLDSEGIQLPSDREKLQVLQAAKAHDIAASLTPDEREEVQLRTSPAAMTIRNRYGDVIQSEDEYRQLVALQQAYLDRWSGQTSGPPTPETIQARQAAAQKLNADIQAVLGPAQVAAAQQADDPDNHTLAVLTRRLNLPDNTPATVLGTRDDYAVESMRINADPSLSASDRRTQLQSLAAKAQADLQAVLGTEGAAAYAQRSSWVNLLKLGTAFSTNPSDAQGGYRSVGRSVFPVAPARPRPAAPPGG